MWSCVKYDSSYVLLTGGNACGFPATRGFRIFSASICQRVSTDNGVHISQGSLRPSVPIQNKGSRSSASGGIELRGSIHSFRDEFIVQSNTSASPKRTGPSFRPREALGETHLLCTNFHFGKAGKSVNLNALQEFVERDALSEWSRLSLLSWQRVIHSPRIVETMSTMVTHSSTSCMAS